MSLRQTFDHKLNALNAIRLAMAIGVIVWHSYPLSGHDISFAPLRQFVADVWVDGFFAISGFLITSSWVRRPDIWAFVAARALRILPAFYVCLIVTAFVVAPVGIAWQGGNAAALLKSFAPFEYVSSNMAVWVFQRDIGGTPANVPHEGTWNGSLWTLGWEALCYVGVLVLGLTGLLRRRWVLPSTFGAVWIVLVASTLLALPGHLENGARFGIMFLAGAVIFQYQDSIRCSWALVGAAVAITAGSMFLTDYRLVGAIFWAYAVICAGALIKVERLRLREDLSYGAYIYAFPIQQLLVIAVGPLTPLLFAVVATAVTLPIAAMSWFAVEKPTLRLKNRLDRESVRNRVPST